MSPTISMGMLAGLASVADALDASSTLKRASTSPPEAVVAIWAIWKPDCNSSADGGGNVVTGRAACVGAATGGAALATGAAALVVLPVAPCVAQPAAINGSIAIVSAIR